MTFTTSCGSQQEQRSIFLDQGVVAMSSPLGIASVLLANKDERAIHFPIHLK